MGVARQDPDKNATAERAKPIRRRQPPLFWARKKAGFRRLMGYAR
jgi:hypothetical protein